jgi:cell division protein FtsZ
VNIIFGTVDNDNLGEDISITIIATGLEKSGESDVTTRYAGTASPIQTPVRPAVTQTTPVTETKTATYAGQNLSSQPAPKPSFLSGAQTESAPKQQPVHTTTATTPVEPKPATRPVNKTDSIKIPVFLQKR